MRVVAWQNMLSPHQAPLLNALADSPEVESLTLIVEQELSQERADMGWKIPELTHVDVLVSPERTVLDERIDQFSQSVHLVSGFAQGKYGSWIRQNIPTFYLYTELAKSDSAWRRLFNIVRYRWFYWRAAKQVLGVFAIGSQCPIWLKNSINVELDKILPFGYFMHASDAQDTNPHSTQKVMFVGRLEPVKGIVELVECMIEKQVEWQLIIIGDGSQRRQLERLIDGHENITMLGTLPQTEILSLLQQASVLALPNQKEEGWGFVVNEALMNGTAVYCTDLTGARQAVKNAPYCQVFSAQALPELVAALDNFMQLKYSSGQRQKLKDWYNQSLSVDAASEYMLEHFRQRPQAPLSSQQKRARFGWL